MRLSQILINIKLYLMILSFIGPSGCGKDTQVSLLANDFEVENISTGELLRDLYDKGDTDGAEAAKYSQKGKWVPDEIIMRIVQNKLKTIDRGKVIVLNGFPRTVNQAKEYDKLKDNELRIDKVVYFNLDNESAINRLSNRRICPKCQKIYHLLYNPSKLSGKCENCKVDLYQRKDDEAKIIIQRLKSFNKTTKPILHYYEKQSRLIKIDATPDINTIYKDIKNKLKLNA